MSSLPPAYRVRGQQPSKMQSDSPHSATATIPSEDLKATNKIRNSPSPDPAKPPSDWWSTRDSARPWTEREVPQRKRTIPPEQEDRWRHTRARVAIALRSVLGDTLDITHEVLIIGAEILPLAPIPGLSEAANVLVGIWNTLQQVETNRLACLRLTERCADILLAVREEIFDAGDTVGHELAVPLTRLTDAFKQVQFLLEKQVHRPFLKRYLKRDEILFSIGVCDAELRDALSMFSVSIQIRTLKQLQAAEARRQAAERKREEDMRRLMAAMPHSATDPHKGDNATMPTQTSITLPSPSSFASLSPTLSSLHSDAPAYTPPDSPHAPVPPLPEEIQARILALAAAQNAHDDAHDSADLRRVMRAALASARDADMVDVLQVRRAEMPEALKALQRALEQCATTSADQADQAESDQAAAAAGGEAGLQGLQLTGVGVEREGTPASQQSSASSRSRETPRSAAWSWASAHDPLDREFIETGIDALRRVSDSDRVALPSWTITRYEIDLEERIGLGLFSSVYRATWRARTVAVKVLRPATPRATFAREAGVWKALRHAHVLPLLGASAAGAGDGDGGGDGGDGDGDAPWFFVSPYMRRGTVCEYLRALAPGDAWDPLRMLDEVARGMEYLHGAGVLHGDLKGSNVLIADDLCCVIADFGQSEMKSEAYRLSGTPQPHGTLRWQAPELIDTTLAVGGARLTPQADVYAYAMLCVEILTKGGVPWSAEDDDAVRRLVLVENKRPPIPAIAFPTSPVNADLERLVGACWARDAAARPPFREIARETQRMRRAGGGQGMSSRGASHASSVPVQKKKFPSLWVEEDMRLKKSPDMKPAPLPNPGRSASEPELLHASRAESESWGGALEHSVIPIQRIITPIRDDPAQAQDAEHSSPLGTVQSDGHVKMPEPHPFAEAQQQQPVASETTTTMVGGTISHSSSRTSTTESGRDAARDVGVFDFGAGLARFESPPPADEMIAMRKNESRYRFCLKHDFHRSLTLPLWEPSQVKLGAVGFLSKPRGEFVTLFNAFDPSRSSAGRTAGMPSLYGYGRVEQGSQRQDKRTAAQRGLDAIYGLMMFKSRGDGLFSQSVSRRYSFPLLAGYKNAYLCTESTRYRYVESLATPKAWFKANIDAIVQIYGQEHRLRREDVLLVIGTLEAPDYALFVSHNNPDGQVHFNIFSPPRAGKLWGTFSIDTEASPVSEGGPSYHEDVPGKHVSASKVSTVKSSATWDTVLIARLRFKTDADEPTSL